LSRNQKEAADFEARSTSRRLNCSFRHAFRRDKLYEKQLARIEKGICSMKASIWFVSSVLSVAAFGQPAPGQPPGFTCIANAGTPVIVRTEGITELVGDLLLQCSGGTPTAPGAPVPLSNIKLQLNTPITSRLFPNGYTDALLMIDEPGSALNANTPQLACPPQTPCIIQGNGSGANLYNGSAGYPNVYQGRAIGATAIEWDGVPIDAPGTTGIRIVRMTNVRANANQLGLSSTLIPTQIVGFVSVTGANFITINNPQQVLAALQPGLLVGVNPSSFQWCDGFNQNQPFSETTPGVASPAVFQLTFKENFGTAFKTRVSASQSTPGQVSNTESGLVPNASAGLPSNTGRADTGTILHTAFPGVPQSIQFLVPQSLPLMDSAGATAGTVTTAQNGTIVGNNVRIQPDATGTLDLFFQVTQRDPTKTGALSLTAPVTVTGTPFPLPWHIEGVSGFANSQFPQTNLFAPGSSLTNLYPVFNPLDSGISNPALIPYLFGGSIVPCTNSGNTLNTTGSATPTFVSVGPAASSQSENGPQPDAQPEATTSTATLIAPRISNVGIVSTALASTGVSVTKDPTATWLNVGLSSTTTPVTLFLSVNAAATGPYSTTLKVTSPNVSGTLSVPVTYNVTQAPWFTRFGFAHAASYVNNVVAPGEPFVLFGGDGFGPTTIAGPALGADGRAVSTLGNTQVLFDDVATPLYYSVNANGIGQVAGFAPFNLANKTQTNVKVVYNGVSSPPVSLFVLDAVPGLFTADTSGGGQGSFLNQDLSVNSSSNPESPGNLIVLYGGGAGQTTPGGRDGALSGIGGPLAKFTLPVKVFIDGIAATDIPYSGPAPGLVEGVFQINVRIPAGVRHNANVPVIVQIEDKQTQPGVTIATK
jgi:uncharacterized protein (TIGR03437 family)